MALAKTYLTVNGKIRSEQRAGEAHSRDYVLDPLGSVIQIYQNGWPIADACYEPYGGIYTQWNMEGKTFTWLGGWGYRQTGVEWSSVYVRARHYSRGLSNWTSIDPLWPSEMAYGYVEGRVMTGVDPSGMQGRGKPKYNPPLPNMQNSGVVPCGNREPYRPCLDLLADITPRKEDMQFLKCLRKAGRNDQNAIKLCIDKYRGSKNFDKFVYYAACVLASNWDPSLNRTNPCKTVSTDDPGAVTIDNQICCDIWFIRCMAKCKSGSICIALCRNGQTQCYTNAEVPR